MAAPQTCRCCGGTGTVPDADGKPRPCSRCQVEKFHAWAASRYPAKRVEAG